MYIPVAIRTNAPNNAGAVARTASALKSDALPPGGSVLDRDCWCPGKWFASWADPRTTNLAFHRYGVSGSMLIAMVNRGRFSFHGEQYLTRGTRYSELLTLFLRGVGVE
jgi:hypothetical protein